MPEKFSGTEIPHLEQNDALSVFLESDMRLSDETNYESGFQITVCDGKVHRTFSGGAWDTLLKVEACNGACEQWHSGTGRDVQERIPNLIQCNVGRTENYVDPGYLQYQEESHFEETSTDQRDKLFTRLQEIGEVIRALGIQPWFALQNKNTFNTQWKKGRGLSSYPLADDLRVVFNEATNDWSISFEGALADSEHLVRKKVEQALIEHGISIK